MPRGAGSCRQPRGSRVGADGWCGSRGVPEDVQVEVRPPCATPPPLQEGRPQLPLPPLRAPRVAPARTACQKTRSRTEPRDGNDGYLTATWSQLMSEGVRKSAIPRRRSALCRPKSSRFIGFLRMVDAGLGGPASRPAPAARLSDGGPGASPPLQSPSAPALASTRRPSMLLTKVAGQRPRGGRAPSSVRQRRVKLSAPRCPPTLPRRWGTAP